MAMTVTYSVVPRKNPAKKDESAKYYAQAQASGELDFEELCEGITSRSTCTETDVRAAISGILYEAKRALKAGRIVRLGDLGSLQIGLNSEGAVSVKEFSSSLITAAHIIFRPGKTLADITKILSYQQVTTRAVAQTGGSAIYLQHHLLQTLDEAIDPRRDLSQIILSGDHQATGQVAIALRELRDQLAQRDNGSICHPGRGDRQQHDQDAGYQQSQGDGAV